MMKKQKIMLNRIIAAAVIYVPLFVLEHMGKLEFQSEIPVQFLLFMIPYLIVGWDIIYRAVRNISHGQVFDENFLMAVATIGAILLGDYKEGVAVMLFYQIGELFQSYAVGKSRRSITALMDIRPDYANIEQDGKLVQVDPDDVAVGSIILVQPGEKIPLDGVVLTGESTLNTAALTGESRPRTVRPGDEVISGCVNMTGVLKIRTTKLSNCFRKGHRIRVTVTSSAKNFIFPNSNTREGFASARTVVAHNRVYHGGLHASRLTVRVEP